MGEKFMGFDEENDRSDPEVRKTVAPRVEAYRAERGRGRGTRGRSGPVHQAVPPTDALIRHGP